MQAQQNRIHRGVSIHGCIDMLQLEAILQYLGSFIPSILSTALDEVEVLLALCDADLSFLLVRGIPWFSPCL